MDGSVFREVSLEWRGEQHTITPSVLLLRRIKAEGINNLVLANECMHGGADPSELAVVHRIFMAAAGVLVTDDESYGFLTGGDTAAVVAFQTAYVNAVVPSVDLGKKPAAPAKQKRATKARKAQPKT